MKIPILDLAPRDPYVAYQAAVVYEIAGDRDRALAALQTAIKQGYPQVAVDADPELEALRASAAFRNLRAS